MMLNAAHASRYHWEVAGTPLHVARGEWQISRVYALVGRPEPALHHARNSLQLCSDNCLGDFDSGFAYEAVARVYAIQGDLQQRDVNIQLAMQCARIGDASNKKWLLRNIDSVTTLSLQKYDVE